jgi:hypothetical protein
MLRRRESDMETKPFLIRAPTREGKQGSARPARAASQPLRVGERALAMSTRTAAPRSVAAIPVFAASEREAPLFAPLAISRQRKLAIGAVDDSLEAQADTTARSKVLLPNMIQRKLIVGEVNDPLEDEADRVADKVMHIPGANAVRKGAPQQLGQRYAAREAVGASTPQPMWPELPEAATNEVPGIVHKVLSSPGQPLDESTRSYMEPRFGYDFSRVRIHTDSDAAESAKAVSARAYTVGSDVVLAGQTYAPHAPEGRKLLAHELAHVVQQSSPARTTTRLARQEATPPEAGKAPVAPAVANIPWGNYVDLFAECDYDVNYRVTQYFSSILHLKYNDGTELELDIDKDFVPKSMTSEAARDAMAHGRVGPQGRIFPEELAPRTVPRLWAAREAALQIQNEAFADFAKLAVTGVVFALSVPAMPAGIIDEAAISSVKVTRRPLSGTPKGANVPPGNEPPSGGTPPGPGGGFNKIPYGQTADSLGRVIGSRAAEAAKTTARVAAAAGEEGRSGPSWINRIVSSVRALKLSPRDSADVIESATTAASYDHGPRATLQDGTLVVTSARAGPNNFIVGIRTDGSIVRGLATIEIGPSLPGGVRVTDVVWD